METNQTENLLLVRTYNNSFEANLAKGKLANGGIECFLEEENVVGLNPLGGTELKVLLKDIKAAELILNE